MFLQVVYMFLQVVGAMFLVVPCAMFLQVVCDMFLQVVRDMFLQVVGAMFLMLTGVFFVFDVTQPFAEAGVRGLIDWASFFLIFLAPLLTMRSLAEEQKLGTLELLLKESRKFPRWSPFQGPGGPMFRRRSPFQDGRRRYRSKGTVQRRALIFSRLDSYYRYRSSYLI